MATTSKFTVYNDALRELGSHPLANLTSTNTRLTELNGAFPHAVEYLLARVDWNFARRRAKFQSTLASRYSTACGNAPFSSVSRVLVLVRLASG